MTLGESLTCFNYFIISCCLYCVYSNFSRQKDIKPVSYVNKFNNLTTLQKLPILFSGDINTYYIKWMD